MAVPRKNITTLILGVSFVILGLLYALWSWISVAPGLIFSTNSVYLTFQNFLQNQFYANRQFITYTYTFLTILLFVNFIFLYQKIISKNNFTLKKIICTTLLFAFPYLLSYNALSYDVFNYLFNAKMVAVYHDNPHLTPATDYPADDWTRFMHNVHTTAPYGYGWTGISLLPYFLGFGKFTPAWISFRLCNLLILLATVSTLYYFQKKLFLEDNFAELIVINSPLLLIELISNIHNDLYMMLPMLWSLYLLFPRGDQKLSLSRLLLSIFLYILSLSVKYATLALLPLWLFLLIKNTALISIVSKKLSLKPQIFFAQLIGFVNHYFFDLCALLMFLPLLTARSQRFHPWYLTWCLVFLPLSKSQLTRVSLFILSVSAMLRYIPELWLNGFDTYTTFYQQLITLLPVCLYWLYCLGKYLSKFTFIDNKSNSIK